MERELRNPALVNETLALIDEMRIEMKNILNIENIFAEGFDNFLKQIELINLKDDELDEVRKYIEQNLQSTVGYWTEEEVVARAKNWRLEQTSNKEWTKVEECYDTPMRVGEQLPNYSVIAEKRKKAKEHIASISSLNVALALLNKLCDEGGEWLLDRINS
ncbi:MAG: hypothetical protein ACI3YZ_12190 [Prevotella sp.]